MQPVCIHFGHCGGCLWQDVPYEEQLRRKEERVRAAFEALGLESVPLHPILPSPAPLQYRNKMEFTAVPDPERGIRIGLHACGRFDQVVEIEQCLLPPEPANQILECIRQAARQHGVSGYDYQRHEGFLRNIVLRFAEPPPQWMVLVVTVTPQRESEREFLQWLAREVPSRFPQVRTIVHVRNDTWSPVSYGEPTVLFGDGVIEQQLCGLRLRISPFAFFQVNRLQLERFFGRILELCQPQSHEIGWDLYCGAGVIALLLAQQMRAVVGIELVEDAIRDARLNAQRNGIANVEWYAADLHRAAARALLQQLPEPDLIVVDPPRAGIHWRLLQALLERPAARLVYVSCNPETQARDLRTLLRVYRLEQLQPVDLFPQTPHVECIAQLRRD